MTLRWFIYTFVFSFGLALYILYPQYEIFLFFMLILSAPIFSFIFLLFGRCFSKLTLPCQEFLVTRDEQLHIPLTLKNSLYLSLAEFAIKITEKNAYEKKQRIFTFTDFFLSKTDQFFTYQADCCGHINIKVNCLMLYDLLGLIRLKKDLQINIDITVLPKLYENIITSGKKSSYLPALNGELLDIRPYRYGDQSRNIEWKISAAHDDLYVRDFYQEDNSSYILLLDSSTSVDKHTANGIYDTAYNLAAYLIARFKIFDFYYLNNDKHLQKQSISTINELNMHLFSSLYDDGQLNNLQALSEKFRSLNKILYVTFATNKKIQDSKGTIPAAQLTNFIVNGNTDNNEHCIYIDPDNIVASLYQGVQQI